MRAINPQLIWIIVTINMDMFIRVQFQHGLFFLKSLLYPKINYYQQHNFKQKKSLLLLFFTVSKINHNFIFLILFHFDYNQSE